MKFGAEMTSWFHAKLSRARAAKLGRIRVSTVVLIGVFAALFWVQQTFPPQQTGTGEPETVVVPPGFVPDPNYTWVPRTNVVSSEPATTTTTTPTSPTETTSPTTSPGETTTPTSPEESTPTSPTTTSPSPEGSVPATPPTSAATTTARPEAPATVPAR